MKGATDYEDQGDLKTPVNQVVAVLPPDADVSRIVAELHKADTGHFEHDLPRRRLAEAGA
jgi:hypothetical protein